MATQGVLWSVLAGSTSSRMRTRDEINLYFVTTWHVWAFFNAHVNLNTVFYATFQKYRILKSLSV